ncbi:3-hydroxyacyl-CoA dehydrogenase family protein [Desulfogranum mediterraneum]|uniref:3-hydroxyacyl-CoA dehydrogenase family protein n=1 Tax=Desulfogranum mediterraneum TaxID=160661 RepID=UPI0004903447|nr:3-hydroxyacyl-CoA dehydrogenase NAD-binding domain-containing protein [Desulfogranum mediterraneum]
MTTSQRIMVIGAGQMGSGIAQVAAQAGYQVLLSDLDQEMTARALQTIEARLQREVERAHAPPAGCASVLARITPTTGLEGCEGSDWVIEAASERLELKRKLFRELGQRTGKATILASNTSSLSITEIAAASGSPRRVIGMHFMNPVPRMMLVEVIQGLDTAEATSTATMELARSLGKEPVLVKDYPGFISNRLLLPLINEAIFAVHEGVAEVEAVDRIMQLGMNHPMGPLALADLIGLDTCLAIMEILQQGFGDDKYRPCPLLVKMVRAGRLGRKSGQGFYPYPASRPL